MAGRPLRRPEEPQGLAWLVAALRVVAAEGEPTNATERKVRDRVGRDTRTRKAAERMVKTFDEIRPSIRERTFGDMGKPTFRIGGRAAAAARPTVAKPRSRRRLGPIWAPDEIIISPDDQGGVIDPSRDTPGLQYTIRFKGLHCKDETGWFDEGSDEIYVITSVVTVGSDGQNIVRTEHHPVDKDYFGGVDVNDVRVGPVAASWAGNSEPVSLTVVVFEHDEGDPDYYKDEINTIVKTAVAGIALYYGIDDPRVLAALDKLGDLIADAINWLLDTGDDQVDIARTLVFSKAKFEAYGRGGLRAYWAKRIVDIFPLKWEDYYTGIDYHFLTGHNGAGGNYVVLFDIDRNPDFEPVDQPVE